MTAAASVEGASARASRPARSFSWHLGLFAAGLVLPALAVVAILLGAYVSSERERVEAEARGLARMLATALDRDLTDLAATLQALATSPALERGDALAFHAQATMLRRWQDTHFSLRDDAGVTLAATRLPPGERILVNPAAVTEADRLALTERRVNVSDVFMGPVSGRPAVQVMTPVPFHDPPRLVVGASLDPDRFLRLLERFARPPGYTAAIIDGAGTVVARTPGHARFVGGPASEEFRRRAGGGSGLYYGANRESVPSLVAYDSSTFSRWRVAVTLPAAAIDGALWTSALTLAATGAGLGAIGAALAWAMRRRLDRAVSALGALPAAIRSGSTPPPIATGVREIDAAGAALGRASADLAAATAALRDSEERLRGFATSNVVGMVQGDIHGGVATANDEFLRIIGRTRAELAAGAIRWDAITPPDWLPVDAAAIAEARLQGACAPYEKEYLRPDGTRVRALVGFSLGGPERTETVVFILDLTERERIARALAETAERLEIAQEAAQIASWDWRPDAPDGFAVSAGHARLYDLAPDAPPLDFDGWMARLHPEDRAPVRAAMERTLADPATPLDVEFRAAAREGGWKWLYARGRAVADPGGGAPRLAGVTMDVSARKALEERQTLLVRELHHRVKNTLSVVQSLCNATLRSAPSMEAFRDSFFERIASLARTHELLTDRAWTPIDLRQLALAELAPFEGSGRLSLTGPRVSLPGETAVPIGMALHELATNAAKYGALSAGTGRVALSWTFEPAPRRLTIEWRESGGPPVAPPLREGFGSRLISRAIGAQLRGRAEIRYESGGVVATIEASLDAEARAAA